MAQVLLIEDDPGIRSALIRALGDRGHGVSSAPTGMTGLQTALSEQPDIVVLDLGLPDVDGKDLLRMLRAVSDVPVVVATARDDETEIIGVLDAGADDYLVKPFGAGQLDARIRAVLRRGGTEDADTAVEVGAIRLDPRSREATVDDAAISLTPREFDLLHYLAARAGTVVSKRELLTEVWQLPYGGADKTVDVHLSWLRRKLGDRASYLQTVRGVGIKLVAD